MGLSELSLNPVYNFTFPKEGVLGPLGNRKVPGECRVTLKLKSRMTMFPAIPMWINPPDERVT